MSKGPPNIRVRGVRQRMKAGVVVGRATKGAGQAQLIPVAGPSQASLASQLTTLGTQGIGPTGAQGPAGPPGPAGAGGNWTVAVVTAVGDIYISG